MTTLRIDRYSHATSTAKPDQYSKLVQQNFSGLAGVAWQPGGRHYVGDSAAIEWVARKLERTGEVNVVRAPVLRDYPGITEYHPVPKAALGALRPYQTAGKDWIFSRLACQSGAILADDMGVGKTIQAIAAASSFCRYVQIVCPAMVVPEWEAQLAKWAPRTDYEWNVTTYGKFPREARNAELLIIDELHYIANPKSKRSVAIRDYLRRGGAARALGLTGTLIPARVSDLWNPLDTIWRGRFGSWTAFTRRYCNGHLHEIPGTQRSYWDSSGSSNLDELAFRLEPIVLRRTKDELIGELPPITRQIVPVTLRGTERPRSITGPDSIQSALSALEQAKIPFAEELAQRAMASGSRPLLLCTTIKGAKELAEKLGVPPVTGEVPTGKRAAVLNESQGCGVATMYSIEVGMNLTGFDVVAFVSLDYLPKTLLQAEARPHRIGQTRPVTSYYLVAEGTIDEVVRERVIERLDSQMAVLGSSEGEQAVKDTLGGNEEDLVASIVAAAGRMRDGN